MGPGSTIKNGEIKLLSRLGLGGFGEVFLAQTKDGLRAVKVIETATWSKSEYQVFNTMLMNEASFLKTLRHPILPRSSGFFAEGSRYFIVMDWFKGANLEEHIEREGPLSLDDLLGLSGALINLLLYLHTECEGVVVFGDLKPANIIRAGPGVYRLVDLGLVSHKGTRFSSEIAVFSPKYGAPERGQGGAADPIHDIYSFGATMHFALTGQDPPRGMSDEKAAKLVAKVIKNESDWGKDSLFSMAELLSLSLAALNSEPGERPPNIRVFQACWERCRDAREAESKHQERGTIDEIVRHLYRKK